MSWLVVNWKRNSHYNIRYCDIASLRWIFWYRRCWWAPALGISGWKSEWVPPAGRISTTRATNSELLSPAGNRPPASTIYPCVEASFQLHYIYVEKHLFNAGVKTDASTLTKTDICTNSNMLKTNIVEPTLLITKKPEPSATQAKYYTMRGVILLIQMMFSTRLLRHHRNGWLLTPFILSGPTYKSIFSAPYIYLVG